MLIFGRGGQIGRALGTLLGEGAVYLDQADVDLSRPDSITPVLKHYAPRAIINAAAYTAVDRAEEEEALAHAINAAAPGAMARYAAEAGIPFVHYSTDYVFDGSGDAPRQEDAPTGPLSAYGRTKRAGEEQVEAAGGTYLIFRTSWVYDAAGKNFVNTMLRLGAEREALNVVADQIGAPSYAPHLAAATLKALQVAEAMDPFPSGIYHMVNAGETSWHGFAEAIFAEAQARGLPLVVEAVHPIATDAYPTPAARPRNSRLDCSKLQDMLGVTLPDWREGLRECMEEKDEATALSA